MDKNNTLNNTFEQNELHNHCLVQLHDSLQNGQEFDRNDWPHHTTLAGVFAINPASIYDGLEYVAHTNLPCESPVTGYDTLGHGTDSAVVALLLKTKELLKLSNNLVHVIEQQASMFKQPAFLGDRYTPHITDHGDLARFAIGTTVRFNQLSLIDLMPDGDKTRRRVIWQSPVVHT